MPWIATRVAARLPDSLEQSTVGSDLLLKVWWRVCRVYSLCEGWAWVQKGGKDRVVSSSALDFKVLRGP